MQKILDNIRAGVKEGIARARENDEGEPVVVFPVQCSCGHFFLEKYLLHEPNEKGEVGFCWCGFCKTKLMVKQRN